MSGRPGHGAASRGLAGPNAEKTVSLALQGGGSTRRHHLQRGLLRELRAIDVVTRLVDAGKLSRDEYKRVPMHRIDGGRRLDEFATSSRSGRRVLRRTCAGRGPR